MKIRLDKFAYPSLLCLLFSYHRPNPCDMRNTVWAKLLGIAFKVPDGKLMSGILNNKIRKIKWLLVILICASLQLPAQQKTTITINPGPGVIINKNIYGLFSEHLGRGIYDGIYRNGRIRTDIAAALKKIQVPVLRWPGGCFADQYHWRDGIGEKRKRPVTVNVNWGMVKENNNFGTDEFMQLCRLIGCEPYIAGNVGTGSPQEMKEWIEYLNYKKKYDISFIGVGNESWDCGGDMTADHYSNLYKQFANFLPNYPGTELKKIASGAYKDDYKWTETILKNVAADKLWGISLHYYVFPGSWEHKGSATNFSADEYFSSLKKAIYLNDLIEQHLAILDKYDQQKKIALVVDEWGIWTDPSPGTNPDFLEQQNSMRDALIAATILNIFNNHAERVRMACLAQTVNVLQSLILTKGNSMLLTPTYHVFDMYKVHQDAKWLPVKIEMVYYKNKNDSIVAINASASKDSNNAVHVSLVNLDPQNKINVTVSLSDFNWKSVKGQVLTSAKFTDVNAFGNTDHIIPRIFNGAKKAENDLVVELPPLSVVVVELK